MKKNSFITLVLMLIVMPMSAFAFSTESDRIDHLVSVLNGSSDKSKAVMLSRLQWSGISSPELYDVIRDQLRSEIDNPGREKIASHMVRALGYSGNELYRESIIDVRENAASRKVRKHAQRALLDLGKFGSWNKLVGQVEITTKGKDADVLTYMKMLSVDDVFVQRLAARAIFNERRLDDDLLALAAEKLEGYYKQSYMDGETMDTAAWLCKAIGQSGKSEYKKLLVKVERETQHPKIKKYARKYI